MAIPTNCKRLAEVDFPIVAVSNYSAKEKDIKTGSFASVHVWWARRPLAACRAMNFACMVPDPQDKNCPTDLRKKIADALDKLEYPVDGQKNFHSNFSGNNSNGDLSLSRNRPKSLRRRLLKFIGEYSSWDKKMSIPHTVCARSIISACHDGSPSLLDSFAGGGSIPIEGQRIGMKAYASDINPIPLMLNRFQLIQHEQLTDEKIVEVEAELEKIISIMKQEIGHLYPVRSDDEKPIGYLSARTIKCEGANCGVDFPLLSSGWAVKTKNKKIAYSYNLSSSGLLEVNLTSDLTNKTIVENTVNRGNATCPICNHTTSVDSVRRQLKKRRGGTKDSLLLAIITTPNKGKGREYHQPNPLDYQDIINANLMLDQYISNPHTSKYLPNEKMVGHSRYLTPPMYGMENWSDIYSARHALSLLISIREVNKIKDPLVKMILAMTVSKFSDRNSSLCAWSPPNEKFLPTFKSHRIQMTWDFYEPRPFGEGGSNLRTTLLNILRGIRAAKLPFHDPLGVVQYGDATDHFLPDNVIDLWATDPPYYDSVPYSDISNYFVNILKRMFDDVILEGSRAPRENEVVMDKTLTKSGDKKTNEWYEKMVEKALSEGSRVTKQDGIGYWVYAHKSTEGWSTVLKGIVNSGWKVTGSWPISTERKTRFRAQNSAALSTSVHIVMRPRLSKETGEWVDILNKLPGILSEWLTRMKNSGVMGADAIYSCIGPAMELFSKYESVERASGEQITIDEYLQFVWDTVADEAVKIINPDADQSSAEPDARFAMMAVWTLRQSNDIETEGTDISNKSVDVNVDEKPSKLTLPFDTASMLARGIGAVIEELEKTQVISVKGNTVKLLSAEERRHYLLGSDSFDSKRVDTKESGIQMKLGESFDDAKLRNIDSNIKKGLIDMPLRKSHLDKLQQAMLLHADGNSLALESHLRQNIGDNPAFWQLANTLNTLYPEGSWERSKVEGVIARYQSLR